MTDCPVATVPSIGVGDATDLAEHGEKLIDTIASSLPESFREA